MKYQIVIKRLSGKRWEAAVYQIGMIHLAFKQNYIDYSLHTVIGLAIGGHFKDNGDTFEIYSADSNAVMIPGDNDD